ncbi:MAG: VUT family protein, partial [Actinobacteria bacterium]|nr:VUT family protein [Actinomycetota bacterium]
MTVSAPNRVHFASVTQSYYPLIVGVFVSILIISNIAATKLISFGPVVVDGGAFLFPLAY